MHQLTIDDHDTLSTSDHPNFGDAHRALLRYVIGADYYLRAAHDDAGHTSYELLRLADPDDPTDAGGPRVIGVATIEGLPDTGGPVAAPYFTACEAQRWIDGHADKWLHGSPTDPGCRYPMAVLTMAQAEAHCYLSAGSVLPEAARLAGVDDVAHPGRAVVEALRHNAIASTDDTDDTDDTDNPAAVAAAVQQLLPAATSDRQAAALVWYYALIRWGVRAP